MISIKNNQRKIKISLTKLKREAAIILKALGYSHFDVNILLTTNHTIRKYNREFRHKDKATDILSFPFHYPTTLPYELRRANNFKPGERIIAHTPADRCLGDIIISLEYMLKDVKKLFVDFDVSDIALATADERMQRLLVHGICHLIGYDHETDEEYEVMLKKENELLTLLQ